MKSFKCFCTENAEEMRFKNSRMKIVGYVLGLQRKSWTKLGRVKSLRTADK